MSIPLRVNSAIILPKREVLTSLLLFGLAFVPRVLNLTAYLAADEAKWILRSAYFLTALCTGDWSAAASQVATPEVEVLAPAVTTMWTGVLGLLAKYQADGASIPLTDYLAALPYAHSEQVSLDFYPWLRFPTVVITSLFVVAFYLLLQKLFPGRRIALTASILLALDPFFLNHSRVIHHDALVTVFVALSLLSLLVYLLQNGGQRWLALSGVALGLAVLTKPTALFLIPFAGLMIGWHIHGTRHWAMVRWGMLWVGIGLLTFVAVWPALWGNPAGTLAGLLQTSLVAGVGDSHRALIPALVPGRAPDLGLLFYPINWLLRWGVLPTLGLGIGLFIWRRIDDAESKSSLAWLGLFSLLLMSVLAPLGTRDIRYYLPAWPALMAWAAFGLDQLPGLRSPLVTVVLSVGLLIPYYPYYVTYYNPVVGGPYWAPQLVKIGGGEGMDQVAAYLNAQPGITEKTVASTMLESFIPYFPGRVVKHHDDTYADVVVNYIRQIQNGNPSDAYLAYFAARVPRHTVRLDGIEYAYIYFEPSPRPVQDVSFGDIKLVAQTLDAPFAEPGQEYHLTLLWQAPPASGATAVRLQVRDQADRVWSESEGPLLAPNGPSAVEGHYILPFPAIMPRGDYQLWATLAPGQNWAWVDTVPVYQFAPPEMIPYPLDANFADLIALHGFDISERKPIPGETVTLTLYWQALRPIPQSYTTFVHLLDSTGNRMAQSDVVPGSGQWPTNTWQAGEWIIDKIPLTLPTVLPVGEYHLLVGWYDWQTSERLLLTSNDNALFLTTLRVR